MHAQSIYYWLDPNSKEFNTICENQLDIIKIKKKNYFEKNYLKLRDSNLYDQVGVFSLSKNPLNENMWAHYSCNSEGFCVGFDSIELLRRLQLKFGFVDYEEQPPIHSFIKDFDENQKDEMFSKNIKWREEEEFRILTLNIKTVKDRKVNVEPFIIKKIIIGNKMNSTDLNQIKNLIKTKYKGSVKLFSIKPTAFNYGFEKVELKTR